MAHFLDTVISNFPIIQSDIFNSLSIIESQLYNAGASLKTHQYVTAGGHLQTASTYFWYLKLDLVQDWVSLLQQTGRGFSLIRTNWPEAAPEAAEITWKSIVEAWAKDDFEGMKWTIATIDHMRKLMWDEPFDIVWAAKPQLPAE